MSDVAVYDQTRSSLRLVDVDAHRERLALIAAGGISVVGESLYEFVNHNHTPGRGHPNAGGALTLPADPGSTAIPSGHVRLWHYSNIDREKGDERPWGEVVQSRVKSLKENGILMNASKTDTYGEPRQIWAAAGKDVSGEFLDNKIMVEFHQHPDTLDIGRGTSPEHLEGNKSHVTMLHDVSPSDIIAIHEPWHERARYFRDNPSTMADAQAGIHDNLIESNPLDYGPAIQWAKQQPKVSKEVLDAEEAKLQVRKAAYLAAKEKSIAAAAERFEEFYNQNHRPSGPGGGQFTQSGGGGAAVGTVAAPKVKSEVTLKKATEDTPGSKGPEGGGIASALMRQTHNPNQSWAQVRAKIGTKAMAAIDRAEARVAKGTNTDELVGKGGFKRPDGTYTTARQALHLKILHSMFTEEQIKAATPPEGVKPSLILTGGRPAAGKSTMLTDLHVDKTRSIVINADDIQEHLPGMKGWNAALYHNEAGDIALQAEKIAMKAGMNVLFDATMKNGASMLKRAKVYQDAGYDIDAFYSHVTPENSALRIASRFMETGRLVPPKIGWEHLTNEKSFDDLVDNGILRHWAIYDNNGTKGKPKLIASSTEHTLEEARAMVQKAGRK